MIETKTLPNDFTYLSVSNKSANAKIALQGAHLFHYQRQGKVPLLYVSNTSHFANGKAIRGGIPVCWPWFGKHKKDTNLPQHGFARTALWQCINVHEDDPYSTEITLQLEDMQKTKKLWPYKADLFLKILISDTLNLQLITTNRDNESFTISSALHSYFSVSDISNVTVKGLDNTPFIDTLTMEHKQLIGDISIAQETDRVYQEVFRPIQLHDSERVITINNIGSKSVVLWNPWIEKSLTMADLDDKGYKKMLCIETANAFDDERILSPGNTHTLGMTIS
jgi:glucose-6-phosphate 1-epimerase